MKLKMLIINKYITKNLITNFLISTFLVVFIAFLTRIVHYADIITQDGGSIKDLLLILLLIQPKILSTIMPFTLSFASFFTYNSLIKNNEHTAIYNAKLSISNILKPLLLLSICLAFCIFILSSFVVPKSYNKMGEIQNNLVTQFSKNIIKPEEFINQKNVTIFIHDITQEKLSKGVVLLEKKDLNKTILVADSGVIYLTGGIVGIKGQDVYLFKKTDFAPSGISANLKNYNFSLTLLDSLNFNSTGVELKNNFTIIKELRISKMARKEFIQRFGMPFFAILLPFTLAIILLYHFNFGRNRASYVKIFSVCLMVAYISISGFGMINYFTLKYQNIFLYFANIFLIFIFTFFIIKAKFIQKLFK